MCKITAQQVVADGQAVGEALDNLASTLQATDSTLATNLETAGNAVIAATKNWQVGTSLAILTDAENAAIVVLDAIPVTSPYAALVAIAFDALNLLIANATTQPQQTGNALTDARIILNKAAELNAKSPWQGKAQIKHHFLNPPRKDFESAWNTEAPKVGVAKITL